MEQTYVIYIGDRYIATTKPGQATYACYEAAKTIAEYTNQKAFLIDGINGIVLATSDDE